MRTALLIGIVGLATLVTQESAAAADKGKADEPEPGTSVEMPYLIAPMTADDKLTAYAYVSSKIVASSPAAAIDVRDKTPFIQDAFVRDVNARPITKASDPTTVDRDALAARLLADAKRIVGDKKVVGITLVAIQVTPLRPQAQH
jgi:hypothetical protein